MITFLFKSVMKFLYPNKSSPQQEKISVYRHSDQSLNLLNITHDFGVGFTTINMEDLKDAEFKEAWEIAIKNNPYVYPKSFIYRDYIVAAIAKNAMNLNGAFLFIGVSWGCAAQLVLKLCKPMTKNIYLMDGWDQSENPNSPKVESYCGDYDFIQRMFGSYQNVKTIKGLAPYALDCIKEENFAFVHISIDSNQAEVDSIQKIYEQCVKGAFILLDCYGTNNSGKGWTIESKKKLKELGFTVIPFLNGQGLLIKT